MSQVSTQAADSVSIAELLEQLTQFDGPPDQFLLHLLSVQCQVVSAESGAMLRLDAEGRGEVLSVWPAIAPGGTAPVWLAQAAESAQRVAREAINLTVPLRRPNEMYQERPSHYLILLPLLGGQGVRGVAAFHLNESDRTKVHHATQRLELTVSMLSLYEMRLSLQQRGTDLARLRQSMEVLAAINQTKRFKAMAMAFCNQIAAHWQADRVSLGILEGRYVKVRGTSHTEKFTRKMKLVQDIESAMEECLDQDVEVVHPAPEQVTYISRSTAELAMTHGPMAVASFPLRRDGKPVAILTVERALDRPFDLEQLETLRLTCDLCTARIVDLHRTDRWFGAKMAEAARDGVGALIGPRHTWIKLAAIGIFAAIVFLTFARGDYRVEAPFVLEASTRQFVSAPFEAYLKGVEVDVDQTVEKDQVLATLDTADILGRIGMAAAKLGGHLREARVWDDENKTNRKKLAEAEADQVRAEIDLLKHQLERATIRAPISGVVVAGDLKKQLGTRVSPGDDALFEIAQLDDLEAVLSVPEDRRGDVAVGATGHLAAAGFPGQHIPFRVVWINPVAQVIEQRNVFRVHVQLTGRPAGATIQLRPGMKGIAKVDAGQRRYAWIWTRRLVNWLRMKLWI